MEETNEAHTGTQMGDVPGGDSAAADGGVEGVRWRKPTDGRWQDVFADQAEWPDRPLRDAGLEPERGVHEPTPMDGSWGGELAMPKRDSLDRQQERADDKPLLAFAGLDHYHVYHDDSSAYYYNDHKPGANHYDKYGAHNHDYHRSAYDKHDVHYVNYYDAANYNVNVNADDGPASLR